LISGVHAILFSKQAEKLRSFFRDVLGWPSVDAGGGWLIFALPPAELAVHPASEPRTELWLMCDDLDTALAELRAKGIRVAGEASEQSWGRTAWIELPDGERLGLYQPKHPVAAGRPT